MASTFFPHPAFAAIYLVLLAGFLAYASISDLRTAIIPKWPTLIALIAGLILNVIRCGWLAQLGMSTAFIDTNNPALGAFDGLLFSLAGFAFGFVVFLLMWMMGVCGGGDVKLFAALGAWLGFKFSLYVLIVTLVVLGALVLFQTARLVITGEFRKLRRKGPAKEQRTTKRLITFALPLAIATLVVLAWMLRFELNLAPAKQAGARPGGHHVQT